MSDEALHIFLVLTDFILFASLLCDRDFIIVNWEDFDKTASKLHVL